MSASQPEREKNMGANRDLDAAKAKHDAAFRVFQKARDDYRDRKIGDKAFLAAKAIYDRAGREYDIAINAAAYP